METAVKILRELESSGSRGYYVGGCVRDRLMGREVHDTDIATDALPERIMEIFREYRTIPTGLKHGTVTVIADGENFEVTTFRRDGSYTDSRRPDSVEFTGSIEEDLSRRDFTINAMAADKDGNIIDPFGGRADIERGVIRCVGEPEKRFTEDALRILRGIRFASQLGFEIEDATAEVMHRLRGRLGLISRERVREELDKLLCGRDCARVLLEYRDLIAEVIPEIEPCFGFEQHSHYHKYDVYGHIVRTVEAAPADSLLLRRAMLLHDIGKPRMFTMDENGEGHFKGHAGVSADLAEEIMKRLRYDNRTIELTCELIRRHSDKIQSERQIKRMVAKLGADNFCLLMELKKADNCGKNEFVLAENPVFDGYAETARRLVAEESCMSLSQLAVHGSSIATLGLKGREIGAALEELLGLVMDGELPNEEEALLGYIRGKVNDNGQDTFH